MFTQEKGAEGVPVTPDASIAHFDEALVTWVLSPVIERYDRLAPSISASPLKNPLRDNVFLRA
jgi:hypothetical protein